jgi:hypothetical protein
MPKAYIELDVEFNTQGQLEVIQYVDNGDLILIQKSLKSIVKDAIKYHSLPHCWTNIEEITRITDTEGELDHLKNILYDCFNMIDQVLEKETADE